MGLITPQEYHIMQEKHKQLVNVIEYIDLVAKHEQKILTHDIGISDYYKKALVPLLNEQAGLQARIKRYEIIGK
jgi:hypothetical protein